LHQPSKDKAFAMTLGWFGIISDNHLIIFNHIFQSSTTKNKDDY
jgi:hypothetical protein